MEMFIDKHEMLSKSGRLIIICGRSGSGKTTLVQEALLKVRGLEYLMTYTTRSPRSENEVKNSFEYKFVTRDEYDRLRRSFANWDHSEIYGEWYGANVDTINCSLQNGVSFVVNTIPTIESINDLKSKYNGETKVIVIDTLKEESDRRITSERPEYEYQRLMIDDQMDFDDLRQISDSIFVPSMNLEEDSRQFCQLIEKLIAL